MPGWRLSPQRDNDGNDQLSHGSHQGEQSARTQASTFLSSTRHSSASKSPYVEASERPNLICVAAAWIREHIAVSSWQKNGDILLAEAVAADASLRQHVPTLGGMDLDNVSRSETHEQVEVRYTGGCHDARS